MVVTHDGLVIGRGDLTGSAKIALTGNDAMFIPYKYFNKIEADKVIYDAADREVVKTVLKHNKENTLYLPYATELLNGYRTVAVRRADVGSDGWVSDINRHNRMKLTNSYKVLALIVNRVVRYTDEPISEAEVACNFGDEKLIGGVRVLEDKYGYIEELKYHTVEFNRAGWLQVEELARFSDMLWEKDMILTDFRFTTSKITVASRAGDRWDEFDKLAKNVEKALRRHE